MKLTAQGRKLIAEYGYNFETLYQPAVKLSENRLKRLFALYLTVIRAGELNEREFPWAKIDEYAALSRQTFLKDLHTLVDLGLLKAQIAFPSGRYSYSSVFTRKREE